MLCGHYTDSKPTGKINQMRVAIYSLLFHNAPPVGEAVSEVCPTLTVLQGDMPILKTSQITATPLYQVQSQIFQLSKPLIFSKASSCLTLTKEENRKGQGEAVTGRYFTSPCKQ